MCKNGWPVIKGVAAGSAAEFANLQVGDGIQSINGIPVQSGADTEDVLALLKSTDMAARTTVTVVQVDELPPRRPLAA